jgi:hypothetical protein
VREIEKREMVNRIVLNRCSLSFKLYHDFTENEIDTKATNQAERAQL